MPKNAKVLRKKVRSFTGDSYIVIITGFVFFNLITPYDPFALRI